jgi:hypothetical protein
MIHLDAYEWDNETFIRTWDTEDPDTILESVERPPAKEVMPNDSLCGNASRYDLIGDHRAETSDALPGIEQIRALRTPDLPELRESFWATLKWLVIALACGALVLFGSYLVRN